MCVYVCVRVCVCANLCILYMSACYHIFSAWSMNSVGVWGWLWVLCYSPFIVNYVYKSKTVLFVGWRHPGIPQHLGSVYIINDLWTSTHASTSLATLLVYV